MDEAADDGTSRPMGHAMRLGAGEVDAAATKPKASQTKAEAGWTATGTGSPHILKTSGLVAPVTRHDWAGPVCRVVQIYWCYKYQDARMKKRYFSLLPSDI